jgi:hypothetical protein
MFTLSVAAGVRPAKEARRNSARAGNSVHYAEDSVDPDMAATETSSDERRDDSSDADVPTGVDLHLLMSNRALPHVSKWCCPKLPEQSEDLLRHVCTHSDCHTLCLHKCAGCTCR